MKLLRATARLAFLVMYTVWIVFSIVAVTAVKGYNPDFSMKRRRRWARRLLPGIGVEFTVEGTPPTHPCLILCNHRSYLDPILLLNDVLAYPVSKAEVEKWPVLGYGAKASGILFLKRESMVSRRQTLSAIGHTIKTDQIPVFLFPEGTTYGTRTTGDFKRGSFQLAASEGIDVVPAVLEYGSDEDYWVGNVTFVPHFLARFGEKKKKAWLRYGPVMRHSDPVELMAAVKGWMDDAIVGIRY